MQRSARPIRSAPHRPGRTPPPETAGAARLSSFAGSSPSAVMQMPRSVAATIAWPSGVGTIVYRIVSPWPPRRRVAGVSAEPVRRRLIGPRAGAETGGIDRGGDGLAAVEQLREAADPARLAPFARRRAGDLLEDAVKMKPADAGRRGQFGEARRRVALADQRTGPADRRDVPRGLRAFARPATLARAEPGGFGRLRRFVKGDIPAQRQPRGQAGRQ